MPDAFSDPPRIAVLMATCNGAAHLAEQLESLAAQKLPPGLLVVSDDGSTDATRAILAGFAAAHPALAVRLGEGPRKGSALNFLSLILGLDADAVDLVAISDQDDVWLPAKLGRAAAALAGVAPGRPALCGGTSLVCDENLKVKGRLPLPRRPPEFRNALVQNFAAGNTMVLNRPALKLLQAAGAGVSGLVVHDWWIYQVLSGAGAEVLFDAEPVLLYRQHDGNLIGANHGALAKLRRLGLMLVGRFRAWNEVNLAALAAAEPLLTAENRRILHDFRALRRQGFFARLGSLRRLGLYRQGLAGNLSLWIATALGKV